MNTPEVYRLDPPSVSLDEILRYMGAKRAAEPVRTLAKEALEEIRNAAECRACFMRLPLSVAGAKIDAGPFSLHSADLAKNLDGCTAVFVFAATIGHAADREIAKASLLSLAKSLALDAAATALIEAVCDAVCALLSSREKARLRPRFSPGYGDLPLSAQKSIAAQLRTAQLLSAFLSTDCIFRPAKTVTAFAGILPRGNQT